MVQIWQAIGGANSGGVIARSGLSLKSDLLPDRVSTGSILQEVELIGERLNYKLLEGSGPEFGWVSISVRDKDLVVKSDRELKMPEPCALVFPGQGSQYVGMLKEAQDIPAVQDMLQKANEILGWDVLDLCLNGPEEKLEETKHCQPCMFIGGLAGVEKLRIEKPECAGNPTFVAGLSLGEYTALCAAGVFSFEDGLKLVKLRGEAMQEAATSGTSKQKMLSVTGLDNEKLRELCAEAKEEEGPGAVASVANALFPNGFSLGGSEQAINILKEKCENAGALQAKLLKTGGAFHTEFMQPAQVKLNEALDEVFPKMKPPKTTIYMNATSEAVKAGSSVGVIVENLKKQLTNTVLWEPSVQKMIKVGITEYYECGPMKQLKAMMKRIDQDVWKTTTNVDI